MTENESDWAWHICNLSNCVSSLPPNLFSLSLNHNNWQFLELKFPFVICCLFSLPLVGQDSVSQVNGNNRIISLCLKFEFLKYIYIYFSCFIACLVSFQYQAYGLYKNQELNKLSNCLLVFALQLRDLLWHFINLSVIFHYFTNI